MNRANSYQRLKRLELLAAQLKERGYSTIKELAELHQVSERTIARDLQLMRDEQGLPIETDRGRGGGVSISPNWGAGRLSLSYPEAVDLLISLAVAEQMNSPLFLANLKSVRQKLVASFSANRRSQVEALKSRILIGVTANRWHHEKSAVQQSSVNQILHLGFLERRQLLIQYQNKNGELSERTIEAHYLMLRYPVWYVVAMDRLREAQRVFRCDRVIRAQLLDANFELLSKDCFQESLAGFDQLK